MINEYEKLWDERAKYYDVDYSNYTMDIEMFSHYMNEKKVVCELGAGTLRIAKLMFGKYKKYYGVDISKEMLKRGISKLSSNELRKIEIIHSGMEKFELPEKADLMLNMGNSFFMIREPGKHQILLNINKFLKSNGLFILEIYNPNAWRKKPQDTLIHLRTIIDDNNKNIDTLTYTQHIDEDSKINNIIWFRESVDRETQNVKKNVFPIKFYFLDFKDARELISNYFRIEENFGGFEREEFNEEISTRMIFICRKK